VAAGLLVGLGAVLHVLEGIVPIPVTVPGAKLGLANAATLLGLAVGGPAVAMAVAVVRPVLGGFVGGGFGSAGFVLSVAGSLAGALAMCGLWRLGRSDGAARGRLSLTGVSLAGGVAHNLGQLTVATRYVGTAAALAYLGPLMLAGLVAGYLVGRLATAIAASPLVRGGYPGVS
jgi:heptaprenyl diphosphate synthase